MRKFSLLAASVAVGFGALFAGSDAKAVPINAPVPLDLIVSVPGLEWVWASPCSGGCSTIDFTFQGPLGWRFATPAEFINHPTLAAFTIDAQLETYKCASAYFDSTYTHCDSGDFKDGFVTSQPDGSTWETLLVRSAGLSPTPVPGALPLFASVLGGAFALRRWRNGRNARKPAKA